MRKLIHMTTFIQSVNRDTHLARHSRRWRPEIGVVKARFSHPKRKQKVSMASPADIQRNHLSIVIIAGYVGLFIYSSQLFVVNEEITAGKLNKLLM